MDIINEVDKYLIPDISMIVLDFLWKCEHEKEDLDICQTCDDIYCESCIECPDENHLEYGATGECASCSFQECYDCNQKICTNCALDHCGEIHCSCSIDHCAACGEIVCDCKRECYECGATLCVKNMCPCPYCDFKTHKRHHA